MSTGDFRGEFAYRALPVILGRCLLLLLPVILEAQPTIHLAAGGYLPPAGIAAKSAQILAGAMVSDGAGTLYFLAQNRVYKSDSSGTLSIVAGTGDLGFAGEGGSALNALFHDPTSLALDGVGNLYIEDGVNRSIRKVNLSSGIITNLATGSFGVNQANMTFDRSGKLFVIGLNIVYQVDIFTGTVTALAGNGNLGLSGNGGTASDALLNSPTRVISDGQGSVYILEGFASSSIRKINLKTGIIDHWTPGDQFSRITTIAADPSGAVYVADTSAIWRVAYGGTGAVRIAGTGAPGFSGDGGPALSAKISNVVDMAADGTRLYFNDGPGLPQRQLRIRQVTFSTGIIDTVAGAGGTGSIGDGGPALNAYLANPSALAVDASGNYFIADSALNRVRRVDATTGIITTVAGNGSQGFSGDGGPAISASLNGLKALAVDSAGNLYIGDAGNYRIRKVDAATGKIQTIAGNGTAAFAGDNGPATSAQLSVYALAIEPSGNLLMADGDNNRVRRITLSSGVITTVAGNGVSSNTGDGGSATSASLQFPQGLAVASSGDIYIGTQGSNMRKVATSGSISTVLVYNNFANLFPLASDGAVIYYPLITTQGIYRYDIASAANNPVINIQQSAFLGDGDGGLAQHAVLDFLLLNAMAAGPGGAVYIGDSAHVRVIDNRPPNVVAITLDANAPGVTLTVDGNNYPAPQTFNWISGSTHTVAAGYTPIPNAPTSYSFVSWSNPAAFLSIGTLLTPPVAADFTASFDTVYRLSLSGASTTFQFQNYFKAGTSLSIFPNVIVGKIFTGFSGDLTGTSAPQTLVMNAAHSVTANFADTACTYSSTISGTTFGPNGGPGTVTVTAQAGCPWNASNAGLTGVTIIGSATGSGNGAVQFQVPPLPNTGGSTLSVSYFLSVAGKQYVLTQNAAPPSCTNPLSVHGLDPGAIPAYGVSGTFLLTVFNGCPAWNLVSDSSWLHVTPASASATGTLQYTVDPNTGSTPRTATLVINGFSMVFTQLGSAGSLSVSRKQLNFGTTTNGQFVTPAQTVVVTASASLDWTATSDASYLAIAPSVGNGSGAFTVSVLPGNLPTTAGVFTGTITVSSEFSNSPPVTIALRLQTYTPAGVSAPFGSFDTPANNTTGVAGAIAVTGWALDNIGIDKVDVWREPVGSENPGANGLIFIGNAVFVTDARPDVEAAYPNAPLNNRAGWGYLLLTNFLPNNNGGQGGLGNGTYKLHAIAHGKSGSSLDLGTHAIIVDNAHASRPFGSIDTPGQGDTISGTQFINFGWALTQNPYNIATDASTITVTVDGVTLGHPTYNQFRSDIANAFPGLANSGGAVGYFLIDTTHLANGLHTIGWLVYDNQGRGDGIGSRFFNVLNITSASAGPEDPIAPAVNGPVEQSVEMDELGRMELSLGAARGYLMVNGERRPLPAGSTLKGGVFYWHAGPGFLGDYQLVFEGRDQSGIGVSVRIRPKQYN